MNNNQNRCGCGGQPTVMDIDRETKENTNFRKEAWTGEHLQVTLMCIPTNCDIGAEIHEDTDQLVCIVQGCATISFGATKCSMCDGQRANGGSIPLKVYSVYAPPHHAAGTVQRTKTCDC